MGRARAQRSRPFSWTLTSERKNLKGNDSDLVAEGTLYHTPAAPFLYGRLI